MATITFTCRQTTVVRVAMEIMVMGEAMVGSRYDPG